MPHATPLQPCEHRIPSTLLAQLNNVTTCPPCTIQQYITSVKDIQKELTSRGGIFVSRSAKRARHHVYDTSWRAHLNLRNRWCETKIKACNDIMKYEELEKKVSEGKEMLEEAISLWEKECESLAEVPGYAKEMSEKEVGDIVKSMMDSLRGTLAGIVGEVDAEMSEAESEAAEEEEAAEACPFPDSDIDTGAEDEPMTDAESENVPSSEDDNDEDGEEEEEDESDIVPAEAMDIDTPTTSSPTTPDGTKTFRKRVRFTDFATISSDTLTYIPSLFPHIFSITNSSDASDALSINLTSLLTVNTQLSSSSTLRHHRHRTDAYHRRRKYRFKRTKDGYSAGKWASRVGYEKADTSWFKMDWEDAQIQWRESRYEGREERKVFKSLKAIAGTWVLMRVLKPALWTLEERLKGLQYRNEDQASA